MDVVNVKCTNFKKLFQSKQASTSILLFWCLLKTKQDDKTSNTQEFYFDILSCKLIPDLLKILNVHEMLNQNQDLIIKILECVILVYQIGHNLNMNLAEVFPMIGVYPLLMLINQINKRVIQTPKIQKCLSLSIIIFKYIIKNCSKDEVEYMVNIGIPEIIQACFNLKNQSNMTNIWTILERFKVYTSYSYINKDILFVLINMMQSDNMLNILMAKLFLKDLKLELESLYPETFMCPISRNVMKEPVIDKDGNSWEKENIISWLQDHNTSPITRRIMTVTELVPNRTLQLTIENYFKNICSKFSDMNEESIIP